MGTAHCFPFRSREAALFDPQTWELTAREAAKEGAADGLALTFSPMLDVSRDIRWGRTAEGSGEDTWVAVQMARAKFVVTRERTSPPPDALAACAKHYLRLCTGLAGREYASVDISERTLREVHVPPFDAAVAAGVATIMPAFTDLAGVPMTANKKLLRDHLRGELGFDGVLVSDYNAIGELMHHGIAADLAEAAALALNAGVDIDMMADAYRQGCRSRWSADCHHGPDRRVSAACAAIEGDVWGCSMTRTAGAPGPSRLPR